MKIFREILLEREFWNNGAVAYIERITAGELAIKFSIAPINIILFVVPAIRNANRIKRKRGYFWKTEKI